ncbi:hypothetical protein BJI47_00445 [Rhodococcus sp. 1168]|nr:hypothetical protein BJI47_00445 [Rhodococcus sp. 1168]
MQPAASPRPRRARERWQLSPRLAFLECSRPLAAPHLAQSLNDVGIDVGKGGFEKCDESCDQFCGLVK